MNRPMILTPTLPVADLHCDLLLYLSLNPRRTAHDFEVRCGIPQLKQGGVKVQTMAIFSETGENSVVNGQKQAEILRELPRLYPGIFQPVRQSQDLDSVLAGDAIGIVPAIENASAICAENEDLDAALERLTAMQRRMGKALYLSLTWNTENRFGGGTLTQVGLKEDGQRLVDYLCAKGIALDLSHASDYLAYDLLNYIEKRGLKLPILASHSNMRAVYHAPRNLPDEIAKEIIKRQGLIGLNFVRSILGDSPAIFSQHLEYLFKLGGERSCSFGADFFCEEDLPVQSRTSLQGELFFDSCGHAGKYGYVVDMWHRELKLSEINLKNICINNFTKFYKEILKC